MSPDVLDYLYGLKMFGSKLGLERMRQLVNALNCPYRRFPSIHVAGTNGKGSVCAFLAAILQESGYKVGLYSSPHLVKFNERIQVNGKQITDEELAELTAEIREVVEANMIETTFFEFTTTLAFLYFARKEVDIAIIETGLGGRLDATNVVIPLVSVITNISLEHIKVLGDTKKKIALEKAGIIKSDVPVVVGEEDEKILDLYQDICKERASKLFVTKDLLNYQVSEANLEKQVFTTEGIVKDNFEIGLLGEHQINNALTAILTIIKLQKQDFNLSSDHLKEGLKRTKWPGRLEIINKNPLTIVDSAHNVAGMERLVDFVKKINKNKEIYKKKILIVGFSEDKQIKEMVSLLAPLVDEVIITKGNFKPADLGLLEKYFLECGKKVIKKEKVEDALLEAKKLATEDDLILITGSIYLVGDVLKFSNMY